MDHVYRITPVVALFLLATGLTSPLAGQWKAVPGKPGEFEIDDAIVGNVADGWVARGDSARPGNLFGIQFDTAGTGYHLTLGVGAIIYQRQDSTNRPFQASATFIQTQAAYRKQGYGLFYGGKYLIGTLTYTSFVVRGDGQYRIQRQDGETVTELVAWKAHPAIKTVAAQDPAVNLVEIDAKSDPTQIAFKVNGQLVHAMAAVPADIRGIVGLRAGPSLDLQVDGVTVQQ